MRAVATYLKQNVLGVIAIFIALGGTGYAAIAIPRNSVGTPQLRNGAITPAKLAGRQIAGSIYAWAYIDANGKVLAAHGLRPGVVRGRDGQYGFAVKNQSVPRGCAAVASVASTLVSGRTPGSAVATLSTRRPPTVAVNTFSATGQAAQLPFVVEVLC